MEKGRKEKIWDDTQLKRKYVLRCFSVLECFVGGEGRDLLRIEGGEVCGLGGRCMRAVVTVVLG